MNWFSLFRHFVKEYLNGKLTRDQFIEKWAYSQQVSGIKPVAWRKK